jgi:hypothetical protein
VRDGAQEEIKPFLYQYVKQSRISSMFWCFMDPKLQRMIKINAEYLKPRNQGLRSAIVKKTKWLGKYHPFKSPKFVSSQDHLLVLWILNHHLPSDVVKEMSKGYFYYCIDDTFYMK